MKDRAIIREIAVPIGAALLLIAASWVFAIAEWGCPRCSAFMTHRAGDGGGYAD